MAFDTGLTALKQLQSDLVQFNQGSSLKYDEAPLKNRDHDDDYTSGLLQAIWNIADHLIQGMEGNNLVTLLTKQVTIYTAQDTAYKLSKKMSYFTTPLDKPGTGTIFPSLKYLHRKTDIRDPKLTKFKWVPEVINDKTYQLSLAFRECLAVLVDKEPDIGPLLKIANLNGELVVPFAQMSLSLSERLDAYQKQHPEVDKLSKIFSLESENESISEESSPELAEIESLHDVDMIQEEEWDQRFLVAQNKIDDAQGIVDAHEDDLEVDEDLIATVLEQVEPRKKELNRVLKELTAFRAAIQKDQIPTEQKEQTKLLELLAQEAWERNYLEEILLSLSGRISNASTSLVSSALWILSNSLTPSAYFNEAIEKLSWGSNKTALLDAIDERIELVVNELNIDITKRENFSRRTIPSEPADNLHLLQQAYQQEWSRLQAIKVQNSKNLLNQITLELAELDFERLILEEKVDLLQKETLSSNTKIEEIETIDEQLTLLSTMVETFQTQLETIENHAKTLNLQVQAFEAKYKAFTQGVQPLEDSWTDSLRQNIKTISTDFDFFNETYKKHQSEIKSLTKNLIALRERYEETQISKLQQILDDTAPDTSISSTNEEQEDELRNTNSKLKLLASEDEFLSGLSEETNEDIVAMLAEIEESRATLMEQKKTLSQTIKGNKQSKLVRKYFGEDFDTDLSTPTIDKKNDGLFTQYLKKRRADYAMLDWISLKIATFLGIFGYTTEQQLREQYVKDLWAAANDYGNIDNTRTTKTRLKALKDQIAIGQEPGMIRTYFFSSRISFDWSKHPKDSLQYTLAAFKKELEKLEQAEAKTKKNHQHSHNTQLPGISRYLSAL